MNSYVNRPIEEFAVPYLNNVRAYVISMQKERVELMERIGTLETENEELRKKLNKTRIDFDVHLTNCGYKMQLEATEKANMILDDEVGRLQNQLVDLTEKYDECQAVILESKEIVGKLLGEREDAKNKIEATEVQLNIYRDKVKNMYMDMIHLEITHATGSEKMYYYVIPGGKFDDSMRILTDTLRLMDVQPLKFNADTKS